MRIKPTDESQRTSQRRKSRQAEKLTINYKDGNVIIEGTNASDRICLTPGRNGTINVYLNGRYQTSIHPAQVSKIIVQGKGGNDCIDVHSKIKKAITVYGGSGNDCITGGSGEDRLYGQGGNDKLYGGAGGDFLNGGSGKDSIKGGKGDDVLLGGSGKDKLKGGSGNDRLYGQHGNDKLYGGSGDDFLDGGKGNDYLNGSDRGGKDHLHDYYGKNKFKADRRDEIERGRQTGKKTKLIKMLEEKYDITIANSGDRKWSYQELKQLQKVLQSLPAPLKNAIRGYTFKRDNIRKRGENVLGDYRSNKKLINVYDYSLIVDWSSIYNFSSDMKPTLVHEIAHAYQFELMTSEQIEKFNSFSWNRDGSRKRDDNFARPYGMTNPVEDWATAVEVYFYQPDLLKQMSPEKYRFMQEIFGLHFSGKTLFTAVNQQNKLNLRVLYA